MPCPFSQLGKLSRRNFLQGLGLFAAGVGAASLLENPHTATSTPPSSIPFTGAHQAGITTSQQAHTYFAALDLTTAKRSDIIALMQHWTEAADRLTRQNTAGLTLTFGFGPSLFSKDGHDRYQLAKYRPEALVDLPIFPGDQLVAEQSGGDLSVQACADDPQTAFNAVRELIKLAGYDTAQLRWTQTGFVSKPADGSTPRNLQGFKDGTQNPAAQDQDHYVWVGTEGPDWMQGGSYLVARKIRIALEHWENVPVAFQEQVIGRHKDTGAPIGKQREFDAADLNATDKDGNLVIAENAHIRLAAAANNKGVQILRRGYSYNDGINFVAERWPPWRQGLEYNAGLLFIAYQRDPRTGFISMFDKMAKFDALNQFATHIGSGLFACPKGTAKGEYIGQALLTKV